MFPTERDVHLKEWASHSTGPSQAAKSGQGHLNPPPLGMKALRQHQNWGGGNYEVSSYTLRASLCFGQAVLKRVGCTTVGTPPTLNISQLMHRLSEKIVGCIFVSHWCMELCSLKADAQANHCSVCSQCYSEKLF